MEDCSQLHDECMRVENILPNPDSDASGGSRKNWRISGSWRKDHVLDAFLIGVWTILSQQLPDPVDGTPKLDPLEEHQKSWRYQRLLAEKQELMGLVPSDTKDSGELFEQEFGRKRGPPTPIGMIPGHYKDY